MIVIDRALISDSYNKTNFYTGYTLQRVKTAVINVCPVPYALMLIPKYYS